MKICWSYFCIFLASLSLAGCASARLQTASLDHFQAPPHKLFVVLNFPQNWAHIVPDFEKTLAADVRTCGVDMHLFYEPWKMEGLELNADDKKAEVARQITQEEQNYSPDTVLTVKFSSATVSGLSGSADFYVSLFSPVNPPRALWGGHMFVPNFVSGKSIANSLFDDLKDKNVLTNCH